MPNSEVSCHQIFLLKGLSSQSIRIHWGKKPYHQKSSLKSSYNNLGKGGAGISWEDANQIGGIVIVEIGMVSL